VAAPLVASRAVLSSMELVNMIVTVQDIIRRPVFCLKDDVVRQTESIGPE
jgi:hypothetical protein